MRTKNIENAKSRPWLQSRSDIAKLSFLSLPHTGMYTCSYIDTSSRLPRWLFKLFRQGPVPKDKIARCTRWKGASGEQMWMALGLSIVTLCDLIPELIPITSEIMLNSSLGLNHTIQTTPFRCVSTSDPRAHEVYINILICKFRAKLLFALPFTESTPGKTMTILRPLRSRKGRVWNLPFRIIMSSVLEKSESLTGLSRAYQPNRRKRASQTLAIRSPASLQSNNSHLRKRIRNSRLFTNALDAGRCWLRMYARFCESGIFSSSSIARFRSEPSTSWGVSSGAIQLTPWNSSWRLFRSFTDSWRSSFERTSSKCRSGSLPVSVATWPLSAISGIEVIDDTVDGSSPLWSQSKTSEGHCHH